MGHKKKHGTALTIINNLKDIPRFATEADEARYWQSHRLSNDLLAQMKPMPRSDEARAALIRSRSSTRPRSIP